MLSFELDNKAFIHWMFKIWLSC